LHGKCEVRPVTGHEGPEGEWMFSSTRSLTSTLDGGGWSTPRPAALLPGMTRYPLYRKSDGPQSRSGRVRKILTYRDSIPGPSIRTKKCTIWNILTRVGTKNVQYEISW